MVFSRFSRSGPGLGFLETRPMQPVTSLLSFAALVFWTVLLLDRKRRWPSELELGLVSGSPPGPAAQKLAVVVPARDEADTLRRTLPSLLEQADCFRTLVVVDDRSSDGTDRVASELAAQHGNAEKVRVIRAEPPPPGWTGKLHALETGLKEASRERAGEEPEIEWLLFTDADIVHPHGSLQTLCEKAISDELDLVSVMVRLSCSSFWEKLLVPPFVYFFQLLYPFRRVADPSSKVAAAAGGCLLLKRQALERAGGLESVKDEIIDDVAIAKMVKAQGGRLFLGICRNMVSVRAYPRLSDIVRMVSRTAFAQLRFRVSLVLATLAGLAVFFVSPPILAIASAWQGAPGDLAAALAAWALSAISFLPVVRHQGLHPMIALTLPVSAALYGYMTALSGFLHRFSCGPEWKGRPLGRLGGDSP